MASGIEQVDPTAYTPSSTLGMNWTGYSGVGTMLQEINDSGGFSTGWTDDTDGAEGFLSGFTLSTSFLSIDWIYYKMRMRNSEASTTATIRVTGQNSDDGYAASFSGVHTFTSVANPNKQTTITSGIFPNLNSGTLNIFIIF